MTKEKAAKLAKYADTLKNKLSDPTPEKHKNGPVEYKQFLTRELQTVTAQLAEFRLENPSK